MSRLDMIIAALEEARANRNYGYVEVTIPGQETTEIIINHNSALENKIAYYQNVYDENGVHCCNPEIKIVNAGGMMGMSFHNCTEM